MLRRTLLLGAACAFAQSPLALPQSAFAFYDKRARWTCFPVVVGAEPGWRWLVYEHDGAWLAPYPRSLNATEFQEEPRRYELRWAEGELSVWTKRGEQWREVRRLMPLAESPVILYPREAHGDIAALWSSGGAVYYTNRDYKNVYRVPPAALRGRVKGERVRASS